MNTTIVWFRRDLRLADNDALYHAAERGAVIPVYIHSPGEEGEWAPGARSRWWLHHSLKSLDASLRREKSRLVIRKGDTLNALRALAEETGADSVYWNRLHEPSAITRDAKVESALQRAGLGTRSFGGALLFEPDTLRTRSGTPYKVFTPFWQACRAAEPPLLPLPLPALSYTDLPESTEVKNLELLPDHEKVPDSSGFWTPGESAATDCLDHFISDGLTRYHLERDRPDIDGTSRLSPHLHFGEIGPRSVWHQIMTPGRKLPEGDEAFLRQIAWREFSYYLMYHYPHSVSGNLNPQFDRFPWENQDRFLNLWKEGRTGYPFVDAGMRQLKTIGWMHNRVRMVAASFLVKHLQIHWLIGARWFWDSLVDADLACNSQGWQWTAGSGADAAPYFRIFNPVLQGKKFDPEGKYVKRWLPELDRLPVKFVHAPWTAPKLILAGAGVELGRDYPLPVVDHGAARRSALDAYQSIK